MKKVSLIIIVSFLFQFFNLAEIIDLVYLRSNRSNRIFASSYDLIYGLTKDKIKIREGDIPDLVEKGGECDVWTYKGFIFISPGTYRYFFYKNKLIGILYEFSLLASNTIVSYNMANNSLKKKYGNPWIDLEIYSNMDYYNFYKTSKNKRKVQNGFSCIGALICFTAWRTKEDLVYHIMGTSKGTIKNPVIPSQYIIVFHKDYFSKSKLRHLLPPSGEFAKKGTFLSKNGKVTVIKEIDLSKIRKIENVERSFKIDR